MNRAVCLALLLLALPAAAQEKEKLVTISGYVFGDFYAVVSHHDSITTRDRATTTARSCRASRRCN